MSKLLTIICLLAITFCSAQNKNNTSNNDSIMMTVVLRHQQTNPVEAIQEKVIKQKFYEKLTSSHAKILSWNVVMGIGQILTLKFSAQYLREVNNVFEKGAWGGFNTEFYPTYDFLPVYPQMLQKEKDLNK